LGGIRGKNGRNAYSAEKTPKDLINTMQICTKVTSAFASNFSYLNLGQNMEDFSSVKNEGRVFKNAESCLQMFVNLN
jgi:hypothetical protein